MIALGVLRRKLLLTSLRVMRNSPATWSNLVVELVGLSQNLFKIVR
jgi:hypothetical protein